MVDLILQEWVDNIEDIYSEAKFQKDIREAVINNPVEYRQKVEADEIRDAGLQKKDDEYTFPNGTKAPQDRVDFVMKTVDKRMLTESPILQSQNLRVKGGMIVPDRKFHMKQKPKVK